MGFPHAPLEGQGRTDHSHWVGCGVWASRTCSFEHYLDQDGECVGMRVLGEPSLEIEVLLWGPETSPPALPSRAVPW